MATKRDDDAPATKGDFRKLRKEMQRFVTKDDAKQFATKDDLKRFATKDDLKQMGESLRKEMKVEIGASEHRLHLEMGEMRLEMTTMNMKMTEMDEKAEETKEEILRHFDVIAENLRKDTLGADRDEIVVLQNRVTRLERHTGLLAA